MWDKPVALNAITNVVILTALLMATYGALHWLMRLPLFPLREVVVTGTVERVTLDQMEEIVKREIKGNFFTLDLGVARAGFEKLPWVRKAQARKQWPGRLEVVLEEHAPLARWGSEALVNTHGELFTAAYDGKLPLFIGPSISAKEMTIQYGYFKRSLATIHQAPAQLHLTSRRAWQVKLESGLVIDLGREQIEARLDRFVGVFERTMAHVQHKVTHADLRYANGFSLRTPDLPLKSPDPARAAPIKRG